MILKVVLVINLREVTIWGILLWVIRRDLEVGGQILQGEIFRVLGQEVEEEVEVEVAWLITFHTKIWNKKKREK